MKQTKDYTIIALLIPFLIAVAASCPSCYRNAGAQIDKPKTHQCSDKTHKNCDGECDGFECRYEGRECPNYATCKGHSMRDYQIDLHNDTVWVYDGERLVSRYITNWKGQIDTILLKDNE